MTPRPDLGGRRIAFYANNLTERGTAVALFDYAKHNRSLLGNDSLVLYDQSFAGNNAKVIEKFKAAFDLIPCDSFAQADQTAQKQGCDLIYTIKAGKRDDLVSTSVPTMVHAVFSTTVRQVHGASYAYVSEWLSHHCTRGALPWVPHMVTIADTDQDMRADLHIPQEAQVFGCYGGKDSFDIGFVKDQVIPDVLDASPHIYFLFMNIENFIDHPRVKFLPGTADVEEKTAFINTCDAMLHARLRGETFGLAVGEFSLRDKPVLTFGGSKERAHLNVLGPAALVYETPADLFRLLRNFDPTTASAKSAYQRFFSPQPVMQRFQDHLIEPAQKDGCDGARRRLGARRWDPLLLARPKFRKIFRKS